MCEGSQFWILEAGSAATWRASRAGSARPVTRVVDLEALFYLIDQQEVAICLIECDNSERATIIVIQWILEPLNRNLNFLLFTVLH